MGLNMVVVKNGEELINFRIGYLAFNRLRREIANAIDPELGRLYQRSFDNDMALGMGKHKLTDVELVALIAEQVEIPAKMQSLKSIERIGKLYPSGCDAALFDFLWHSDCDGTIPWPTARRLWYILHKLKLEEEWLQESLEGLKNVMWQSYYFRRMVEFI